MNQKRMIVLLSIGFAAALVACPMGCSEYKSSSNASTPDAKPMKAPDKMGGSQASKGTTLASAQPRQTDPPKKMEAPSKVESSYASPRPTPLPDPAARKEPPPPPPVIKAEPPPAAAEPRNDDERRDQAENMIYATIRIKMEEAIAERSKLLKGGRDPADEHVRQLEGTIMRARDLLIENGEVVDEVDPPIVQTQRNP